MSQLEQSEGTRVAMKTDALQVLPILRSSYRTLTKSERRIADYINTHIKEVLEETVSDLAQNTQTSEITVSRFCKKLGYSGLQGLKIALAGEVYSADEVIYQDVRQGDSYEIIAGKMFRNIAEGLQDTIKLLHFPDVDAAVKLLSCAKRIAVYGFGNSATVCRDMETRFLRFGIPVQAYSDAHLQVTSAVLLTSEDVVVAISHTGGSIELLRSVDVAKSSGAKVIGITSYAHSELAKRADITLHGMGREIKYQSESVASRLIHMAIVDLLYMGVAMQSSEAYRENICKMRKVIAEKRL